MHSRVSYASSTTNMRGIRRSQIELAYFNIIFSEIAFLQLEYYITEINAKQNCGNLYGILFIYIKCAFCGKK